MKQKQKLHGCKAPIYAICDLKDQYNIITGDDSGEILVYDYIKVYKYKIRMKFNLHLTIYINQEYYLSKKLKPIW